MTAHHLPRHDTRWIVVRASLLSADRPTDLLAMVEHATALPAEPTAAIAARIGSVTRTPVRNANPRT